MAARLKVYRTQIGFHDTVVAAPNQKAALAAWDVRENLFASGAAGVTEAAAAVAAALARPGVVLRRAVGTDGPFTAEGAALPAVPKLAKPKRAARAGPTATRRPAPEPEPEPEPEPDRSELDAAERALAEVEADAGRALNDLAEERAALDRREKDLRADLDRKRARAEREVERARTAYRRVGGRA